MEGRGWEKEVAGVMPEDNNKEEEMDNGAGKVGAKRGRRSCCAWTG